MVGLARPFAPQEPEAPQGGRVFDLDKRLAKVPDADLTTDIGRAVKEYGVTRFRYQGQETDLPGIQQILSTRQETAALAPQEPEPVTPLVTAQEGESDEALAARARTALQRRVTSAWLRERKPLSSLEADEQTALTALLRTASGDIPYDHPDRVAADELMAGWGKDDPKRKNVSRLFQEYREYLEARAPNSSPEIGYAFAEWDEDRRAYEAVEYGLRQNDPIAKEVAGFFVPLMGEEAGGWMAQAREQQKQIESARLMSQVAVGDTQALESAYAALQEPNQTAAGVLSQPQAFRSGGGVWLLRQQVEAAAKASGIPYEELKGQPVDWEDATKKWAEYAGRGLLGRWTTDKPELEYPTVKEARSSTRDLLGKVLREKYGDEAAELIVKAEEANRYAFESLAETFQNFDPSQVEKFGDTFGAGEMSYGDFLAATGAWTGGDITNTADGRGRVRVADWFFRMLSAGSKWTGGAMRDGGLWFGLGASWGKPKAHLFKFPDGSVFMDSVRAMKYADGIRRNDFDADWRPEVIQADELTLYPKQAKYAERGEEGRVLGTAIKETEEYARIMADSYVFDVVTDRLRAHMSPDDKASRALAGAIGLVMDIGTDPLNVASGGLGVAAGNLRKAGQFAKALHKEGLITKEMEQMGVRTFGRIGKEIEIGYRKGGKKLGNRARVALPDGTVLNADAAVRYRVLQKMLGDEAADMVMMEARAGRRTFQSGVEALASNEKFLGEFSRHLAANHGVVGSLEDAHDLFTGMYGAMDKVVYGSRWDASYLYGKARAFAYGDPSKAIERARGLWMAGIPVSPLVTDALMAPGSRFGRSVKRRLARSPAFREGSQLARATNNVRLWGRSLWDVNVVKLLDENGQFLKYHHLPADQARAFNVARQWRAAGETRIRAAQAEWALLDESNALGVPKEAPAWAYTDVGFMWEAGKHGVARDFDGALRVAAAARKVKDNPGLLAELRAIEDADDFARAKQELLEGVTDAEVSRIRAAWEPYRSVWERGAALNGKVGEAYRKAGIADPIGDYAPHHLRIDEGKLKGIPLAAMDSNGDVVIKSPAAVKHEMDLSGHVKERVGPPTLLDALILGFDPILDMRTAMELRLQRFVDDMAEANLVSELAKLGARPHPDGLRAVRAIMEPQGITGTRPAPDFRTRIRDATQRAASFETRQKELVSALRQQEQAEKKLLRLQDKKGATPAEIEVAQATLDKMREERLAAVAKFSEDFDLVEAELEAWANHSQFGQNIQRNRAGQLKKKADAAFEAGDKEGYSRIMDERKVHQENFRLYNDASRYLSDMGITPERQGALTWELYKKPSVRHLTVEEVKNLIERHGNAMKAVEARPAGAARWHETPQAALDAWRKDGMMDGTHYTRWVGDDGKELTKALANTYQPVEVLLALRSGGARLGKADVLRDMTLFGAMKRAMDGLARAMLPMNRVWKGMVTVWNPSLHFGRRNQVDAYSKMFQYSGLHAMNGVLRGEYNAWRKGSLDFFTDGLGRRIDAKKAWDDAMPLFQSFERRLDIIDPLTRGSREAPLAGLKSPIRRWTNTDEGIAAKVGKQTRKGAAAAKGGPIPRLGRHATQGSAPRAAEVAVPYGAGASEAFDNEVRSWVYFVSRKGGMSHNAALEEAFKIGRDYSNLTWAEARVVGVVPITFYNFFKQNLRSIPALLDRGGIHRIVATEKFRRHMEANLPEDLRPQWMNAMDSILTPGGALYMPRDLGGVSVLDAAATIANGFLTQFENYRELTDQRRLPSGMYMREGGAALGDMASPVAQMVFRGGQFRRLRVPDYVAEAMAREYVDGTKSGEYENPLFRVRREGRGKPVVEVSAAGNWALGLSGVGVIATTLFRHGDAFREGGWEAAFNASGLFKTYPYGIRGQERLEEARESLMEYVDALPVFTADTGDGVWIEHDIPSVGSEFSEFAGRFWAAFGGGIRGGRAGGSDQGPGFLRQLMSDFSLQLKSRGLEPVGPELPGTTTTISPGKND